MMKWIGACLLLLSIQTTSAQEWKTQYDSLINKYQSGEYQDVLNNGDDLIKSISSANGLDSNCANVYNLMGYAAYFLENFNLAISYSQKEVEVRKTNKNESGYQLASYLTAIYMSYISAWTDAIPYMREAVRLEIELYGNESIDYVHLANQLAYYYDQAGAYMNAKSIYENSLAVVKEFHKPSDSIAQVMSNAITTFYFTHGMWDEAEPFYKDALVVMERDYGKVSENYILSLNSLGEFYIYATRYRDAEKVFEEMVKLTAAFYGKESADHATALNNLAVAFEKQGKLNQAEEAYLKCLEIKRKVFTTESEFYALSLSNLGIVYDLQNRPDKAEEMYNEALEIYRKINGEGSHAYGMAVLNLGDTRFNNGKTEDGINLILKGVKILEKAIGKGSVDYANALNSYASALHSSGKLTQAEDTYAEVCRIKHDILGNYHEQFGTAVYDLASLKVTLGKYAEADELFKQALEIIEKSAGKNSVSYGKVLNGLGIMYNETGQMNQAEDNFLKCSKVYEKVYGKLHPEYATLLNNLGQFYNESGEYNKAEKYLDESLKIKKGALGENHPDLSYVLINLSHTYIARSEFHKAEIAMQNAQSLIENHYGTEHPDYASSVRSLGYFYYEIGNYEKAEKYYNEALVKQENIYGKDHPEIATTLNNIGALYLTLSNYAKPEKAWDLNQKALSHFQQAYRIDSVALGTDHPEMSFYNNNLAEAYRQVNKPELAEPLFLKSIEIERSYYGDNYPNIAVTEHNLALMFLGMNEFDKAEKYALKSIKTFENAFGEDNAAATSVIVNLGYIYQRLDKPKKAEDYYLKGLRINQKYLNDFFAFLSEEEKMNYLKTTSAYNEMFAGFMTEYQHQKPELVAMVYDNELLYKGLLLRSSTSLRNQILSSNDTTLRDIFDRWTDVKGELSILYSSSADSRFVSIDSLEELANSLEKKLIASSDQIKSQLASSDWQTVKSNLKPNEYAVEFLNYPRINDDYTTTDIYSALVLGSEMNYPVLVELFESEELEAIIGKLVGKTKTFVDSIYGQKPGDKPELSNLIWSRLDSILPVNSTVYYAPSGLLHKISFGALAIDDTYLSDRYELKNVSNTSKVIGSTQSELTANPGISIFGGAQYSTENTEQEIWKYLAGTETEAHDIGTLFAAKGIKANENIGKDASESIFKSHGGVNSPDILHIATHGFFYADPALIAQEAVVEEGDLEFRGAGIGVQTFVENPNPLMRSGLVFSGANDVWSQTDFEGDDGVLTAYEVSNMFLGNTKLTVMSACETGLGDIQGSEGVYGLQRAFKIAGVKYLIMSLWQVPDKETAEFMKLFYSNLIQDHNIQAAFNKAQSTMREKYAPYYWAAFVLTN